MRPPRPHLAPEMMNAMFIASLAIFFLGLARFGVFGLGAYMLAVSSAFAGGMWIRDLEGHIADRRRREAERNIGFGSLIGHTHDRAGS